MRPSVRGLGEDPTHVSGAACSWVHRGHSSARSSYPYTGGWGEVRSSGKYGP